MILNKRLLYGNRNGEYNPLEKSFMGGRKMPESGNIYTIREDDKTGTVRVADEVVCVIAGLAATEAKGVASLAGNITNNSIPKKGAKGLSKGVRVTLAEGKVNVDLALTIDYGFSVPEVSRDVQERVKSAIENMTGIEVGEVNIRVEDVLVDEN